MTTHWTYDSTILGVLIQWKNRENKEVLFYAVVLGHVFLIDISYDGTAVIALYILKPVDFDSHFPKLFKLITIVSDF